MTGAFAARELLAAGLRVVMLEAREACSGATGRNGGHCQPGVWDSALEVARFELATFDMIENLVKDNGIDCDWHAVGGVHVILSPPVLEAARAQIERLQQYADLRDKAVLVVDKEQLRKLRIHQAIAAVYQPKAAKCWPYKLISWLLEKLLDDYDASTFNLQTNTPVLRLEKPPGSAWVLHTQRGVIRARQVLLATNGYTSHLLPAMTGLILPVRGQASALVPPVRSTPLSHSYVWLNGADHQYLIQQGSSDSHSSCNGDQYLIFGGERLVVPGGEVGISNDNVVDPVIGQALRKGLDGIVELRDGEERSESHAENTKELHASYEWTGIMGYSRDSSPWVGRVPPSLLTELAVDKESNSEGVAGGLWISAGYTGHGMPVAARCGVAVAEMMQIEKHFPLIFQASSRNRKLPPGPRGLPIVANLHQIPKKNAWKKFQEWHRIYGPVVHLRLGQITVILLGSHEVAREVLTKRSTIYSSRPRLVVAGDCIAKGMDAALLPDGPRWKKFRGIQTSVLNARKTKLYRPLQELESLQLLFNLLFTDNNLEAEFERFSSSLVSTLLYGRRFVSRCSPEFLQRKKTLAAVFQSTLLGSWLVDSFPFLHYLPRPLARWKMMGDELHEQQTQLYGEYFHNALSTNSWNWCKQTASSDTSVSERELSFVLGDLFGAGTRTTAGSLSVAVLACASYPETMRRLQEDIDTQVGINRLPNLDDLIPLAYLQAFCQEVFRWRPAIPGGAAHSALRDDEYRGFFIPQGAAVVASHWSLEMDDAVFRSPADFMPERWINDGDLPLAAFGFGKRICPGQALARNSLMLIVGRLLWAFDIQWKHGQSRKHDCDDTVQEGIFVKPGPFEVSLKVRDSSRRAIVTREWEGRNDDVNGILDTIGRQFSET
ncbi:hypothetical protein RJ55_01027 [Drechmeria coniospora]|nr:hypothetical protein RJ55_01027 [Drechmeria coniospora]